MQRRAGGPSVNLSDRTSGQLDAMLDSFSERVKDIAPAGAQAMAQVVYDAARDYVPVRSGRLKSAIYQVYSKDKSTRERAEYHVSWNKSKAPHGHLVEFGTSRAPAHPFLWPAYEHNKARLVATANAAMAARLNAKGGRT